MGRAGSQPYTATGECIWVMAAPSDREQAPQFATVSTTPSRAPHSHPASLTHFPPHLEVPHETPFLQMETEAPRRGDRAGT